MTRWIRNWSGRRTLGAALVAFVPGLATAAVVDARTARPVSVVPATRASGGSVSRSAWMLVRGAPATSTIRFGRRFTVSGNVSAPLYPGAKPEAFRVTLTNRNSFPITVTSLGTVGIHPVNAPGCNPRWFKVTLPRVSSRGVSVAGDGGTVTLGATARMLDIKARQDACQGKRLTLSYATSDAK
jgi:hypothetical protein